MLFDSQTGYIDNTPYNINSFLDNRILIESVNNGTKIYDKDGNELTYCPKNKRSDTCKPRPYFRRLNVHPSGSEMTEWHRDWQRHFPNCEAFYKKKEDSVRDRYADVDLNDNQIIEFQHSVIDLQEVEDRQKDYGIHNKEIVWVIDGRKSIEVIRLEHSGRIILEFMNEPWKYNSFLSYEFIYIDIEGELYQVNPKLVKSRMIDIPKPISKSVFLDSLKNKTLLEIYPNKITQTNIYVKQQGAGNGKTFGIIKLLQDLDFSHYNTFIYLTKQHSAVHVIHTELEKQKKENGLDNIEIIDDDKINKKYIIQYKDTKTDKIKKIIIGTIDSFVYALGDRNCKGVDKFVKIATSIIDKELNDSLTYGRSSVIMNKKLLLVGDEMQDLHENYMKAIVHITRDRYVDFYAVGDKLQSISIEKNAFTYLSNEFPSNSIKVTRYPLSNICWRFTDTKLVNYVNHMVPFEKYNLPEIRPHKKQDILNSLIFIEGDIIRSTDTDPDRINKEVDKLMKYYIKEVEDYGRKSKDFLIVTPWVNKPNPIVENFHMRIREYWKDKNGDKDYRKYSIFHKSEEGTSIDLTESDDCTRIVSIHSSKGDGRPVVFVIGVNEGILRKYSCDNDNLVYDSLLHVALTRMKERLYIRIETNGDSIHQKIMEFEGKNGEYTISPSLKYPKNIQLENLIFNKKTRDDNFNFCDKNIIELSVNNKLIETEIDKELIDMKHHKIRYVSSFIRLILEIIANDNKNNSTEKQQFCKKLKRCKKIRVNEYYSTTDYYKNLCDKDSPLFPVLKYRNKGGDYVSHFETIKRLIDQVKLKIKTSLSKPEVIELDILETICLYYMLEITIKRQYGDFPISDMYDIVDLYNKSSLDKQDSYKLTHYYKINKMSELYQICLEKYPNLKWLIHHLVFFKGKTDNISILREFKLLAYNEDTVLICYIKPQFNTINYNEVLLQSIFDSFIIQNTDGNNNERFKGKKIVTCVFSLDHDKPYFYQWCDKDGIDLLIKLKEEFYQILRNNIMEYYKQIHSNIYYCYQYHNKKNVKPLQKITNTIDLFNKMDNDGGNIPIYIFEYLIGIKNELERCEKNIQIRQECLEKYNDKHKFIEGLTIKLEKMVDNYLGIDTADY